MSRAHLAIARLFLVSAGAVACGSQPAEKADTMTVRGTVSQGLSTTSGARAVAIGSDGKTTVWTTLDGHGDFTLQLPLGRSFRIVIANPVGGVREVAGRLMVRSGGSTTAWIGANEAITVDLGQLTPAGTSPTAASTSSGVRTQSMETSDDGDAEHADDAESHEQDSKDDQLCSKGSSSEVELEPSKQPGDACEDESDHDGGDDSDAKCAGSDESNDD